MMLFPRESVAQPKLAAGAAAGAGMILVKADSSNNTVIVIQHLKKHFLPGI